MTAPVLNFPGKPEFGNPEQIAAIKDYQRQIIESEDSDASAKEWEVTVQWEGEKTVRVRANNEYEAKQLAEDNVDFCDVNDINCRAVLAEKTPVNIKP